MADAVGPGFGFDIGLVAFCLRFGWGFWKGGGQGREAAFVLKKILKLIILFVGSFFLFMTA